MIYEAPVTVIYSAIHAVYASDESSNSGNNSGNTGSGIGGRPIELPFIPGL